MKYLKNIVETSPDFWLNSESSLLVKAFNPKELKLWRSIIAGKTKNNEQASELIYGVEPSSGTFQKFKLAFRNKIDNIVLLYKNVNAGKFKIVYLNALKEQHLIKVLINQGFRKNAIIRAKVLVRNCEKYQFNGIGEDITKLLWKNSAVFEGNMEDFDKYLKLYEKFRTLVDLETKVERYYAELINYYTQKRALNENISLKASTYYNELKSNINKVDSFTFHIDIFRIAIIECESMGDLKGCIAICDEAITYFENLSFEHYGAIQLFKRKKVNYLLQLNQLFEAEFLIQNLIEDNPEKNHMWFLNQEQIFLIKMRSQRYEEAQNLLMFVTKQNRFSAESSEVKDKWKLYKVYIDLLKYMGVLATSPKPAKIIRQINNLSRFKGDKMGMNLALLICQTIYIYFSKNVDHLDVHIDAIKKYSGNYLKEGNDRSKIFLKMLCSLPLIGFEDARFNKNVAHLKEKLNEKSIQHIAQASDIEVIPYEDIWNLILANNQSKKSGSRAPRTNF